MTVKGLRRPMTAQPSFEELEIQLLAAIKTEIAKQREIEAENTSTENRRKHNIRNGC